MIAPRLRRVLRRLSKDRRGDMNTHLLLIAAGCASVCIVAPHLFNAAKSTGNTFEKQVGILETGSSSASGATRRSDSWDLASGSGIGFSGNIAPGAGGIVGTGAVSVGGVTVGSGAVTAGADGVHSSGSLGGGSATSLSSQGGGLYGGTPPFAPNSNSNSNSRAAGNGESAQQQASSNNGRRILDAIQ